MIIPIENEQEFEEVLVRSSSGQHSSLANGGWNDFVSVPRSELAADMTCPICKGVVSSIAHFGVLSVLTLSHTLAINLYHHYYVMSIHVIHFVCRLGSISRVSCGSGLP